MFQFICNKKHYSNFSNIFGTLKRLLVSVIVTI